MGTATAEDPELKPFPPHLLPVTVSVVVTPEPLLRDADDIIELVVEAAKDDGPYPLVPPPVKHQLANDNDDDDNDDDDNDDDNDNDNDNGNNNGNNNNDDNNHDNDDDDDDDDDDSNL